MISPINIIRTIELETGTISLLTNDVILIDYKTDIDIDEVNIVDVGKALVELCNSKPHYFIIDVRNCFGNYSTEAREYMAKDPEINRVRKAFAIITNSLGTRILANFYLRFNKPLSPGKLFSDETKALEWFDTLK